MFIPRASSHIAEAGNKVAPSLHTENPKFGRHTISFQCRDSGRSFPKKFVKKIFHILTCLRNKFSELPDPKFRGTLYEGKQCKYLLNTNIYTSEYTYIPHPFQESGKLWLYRMLMISDYKIRAELDSLTYFGRTPEYSSESIDENHICTGRKKNVLAETLQP